MVLQADKTVKFRSLHRSIISAILLFRHAPLYITA